MALAEKRRFRVPPRFEAKYMVPRSRLPELRAFIEPFCRADPNGVGEQPEYLVTTMQFDARDLPLFEAKYHESLNRFKLRARYYGESPGDMIFLEVKTRLNDCIVKHRARLPTEHWHDRLFLDTTMPPLPSDKDAEAFARFRRLYHEIDATPVVLVRYTRESYFGRTEKYARVTIDRELLYRPCRELSGMSQPGRWFRMDSSLAQNAGMRDSCVVLELKCLAEMSDWMRELIVHFNLTRTGNCKYATAVWLESLFNGTSSLPTWGIEVLG